jgi:hypothetical protein
MKKKPKKPRRESGKSKTDLFENRPSVGFRFIENRSVSVSVPVSRRALVAMAMKLALYMMRLTLTLWMFFHRGCDIGIESEVRFG